MAVALIAAGALLLAGPLAVARADGDPASDVLVAAPPLFLSLDSGATYAQKLALVHQLRLAARRGSTLRVAVIATRSDLGSVTALWGDPQTYAEFLGRELSLDYRGELLVVMPSGFGLVRDAAPVHSPLNGLAPRHGQLITATEQAVARLTGVALPAGATRAVAAGPSRTAGIGWWVTTVAAAVAITLAWTASLRRRPLRIRRRLGSGSAS